jgi:uncharacterized protein involved in outer membrane biogenesis
LELALQTTLLGLAIVIILALVAALVGPLLIDWGTYRAAIDREASRLAGLDVRVTGAIDARLLPSPRLVLHDIEIGRAGDETLRARSLGIEFALSPLMRGEWRASEMRLAGLEIKLGLDASGQVQAPNIALRFNPDALSIDRLSVEDSKVVLSDAANGTSVTLDRLSFNGEVRSLLGPFKGEGAVSVGGTLYSYRISVGRISDDGALKLHVNIDPATRPLNIETDGVLALTGGRPQFDGTVNLSRPVGIAPQGGALVTQPWRIASKVKASAASALMEQIEFQFGSEDQGVKLTGTAEFKFGQHPRFDGVVSGRQIDLDHALAQNDASRPPPVKAIRALLDAAGNALLPPIPVQIGIGIDQVTLGGNTIQTLRGDISADADGWNLDRFEFRAPGFTQVHLSGRAAADGGSLAFAGPVDVETGDLLALAAWLQGRPEPLAGDARPLRLRGEVTVRAEKIAVEQLNAEFDRKVVTGRFAYVFAAASRRPQLEAELNAADLDVDAAFGTINALLAGSDIERPHDISLGLDIARATVAGMDARNASARLKIDGDGLQIDRLSVADLGGATLSASGRIDTGSGVPHGALALDIEARQMSTIAALAIKFAPGAASSITPVLDRIASAKLHATLDVANEKDATSTSARLTLSGDLDTMKLDAKATVAGNWLNPSAANIRIDATLNAPDGAALLKLTGLDPLLAAGPGPGQIKLLIAGPPDRDLTLGVRLTTGNLQVESNVIGRISLADGLSARGTVQLSKAEDLRVSPGDTGPIPPPALSFNSAVAVVGRKISFDDIGAHICGLGFEGKLTAEVASPLHIAGALDGYNVDVLALTGCALGLPVANNVAQAWHWPAKPFGPFADVTGRVTIKGQQMQAAVRFGSDEIAIEDLNGDLAGGRFTGQMSFRNTVQGVAARAQFTLAGVDAAKLYPVAHVAAMLDAQGEIEGSGLTPVALIGSLHGAAKFKLSDAQIVGLDPRVFGAVTSAVDKGLPVDTARIADVADKALDGGDLRVKQADGKFSISAGQVQLNNSVARGEGADVSLGGILDLTDGSIDGRLTLSGLRLDNGTRPSIFMSFKGPVSAPVRVIDVSALTGWLMLHSIEHQAKRLQAIQDEQLSPQSAPAAKPGRAAAPAKSVSPQH